MAKSWWGPLDEIANEVATESRSVNSICDLWRGRHLQIWNLRSGIWIRSKKMATGKVGQGYDATVTSSVPSDPVPPGTVVGTSDNPAVATVGTANASNVLHVALISVGAANITYSAPGFTAVSESVSVIAPPTLVVTDGPVA